MADAGRSIRPLQSSLGVVTRPAGSGDVGHPRSVPVPFCLRDVLTHGVLIMIEGRATGGMA